MRPFLALVFSMCLFGCNDTTSPVDTATIVDAPGADDAATCAADGGCADLSMSVMDMTMTTDGGPNG